MALSVFFKDFAEKSWDPLEIIECVVFLFNFCCLYSL